MTRIVKKIKAQGWLWFLRRLYREILNPHTKLGTWLKPLQLPVRYLVAQPIAWLDKRLSQQKSLPDALYFFYDLEVEPVTYDFCFALAIAEARRQYDQLSQLKVIIVPGLSAGLRQEDPAYDAIINHTSRWWRIYNIILPSTMLLSKTPSIYCCTSRKEALLLEKECTGHRYPDHYSVTCPTTHQMKDGLSLPPHDIAVFQATSQARTYVSQWIAEHINHRQLITITLRQFDYVKERNSNIHAWSQFVKTLDLKRFLVVIIPDVEQAMSSPPPHGFPDCLYFSAACWNLGLRAALYELAYMNLGVNNGPMSLCWLNPRCCYITFKMFTPGVQLGASRNMQRQGLKLHRPPPFAQAWQRWVWGPDNTDNISKEFHAMLKILDANEHRQAVADTL